MSPGAAWAQGRSGEGRWTESCERLVEGLLCSFLELEHLHLCLTSQEEKRMWPRCWSRRNLERGARLGKVKATGTD